MEKRLAKEKEIRSRQIRDLKEKHDTLARKFWEPYLELRGADMATLAPEGERKRGKEAAKFAEIIKIKYNIYVNTGEISDCYWQGNTLVARFHNMKPGSTYNKITFRPNNWKGTDDKVSVDRKKSPEEREILSALAWVRRRDEESGTEKPRITWCRLLPRGVAYKAGKNADLTFVRSVDEARELMDDKEIDEYQDYVRNLKEQGGREQSNQGKKGSQEKKNREEDDSAMI